MMMLYDSRLLFRFASSYTICSIAIDEFVVNSMRYDIGSCCESSCCEAIRFKNDIQQRCCVIGTHTQLCTVWKNDVVNADTRAERGRLSHCVTASPTVLPRDFLPVTYSPLSVYLSLCVHTCSY